MLILINGSELCPCGVNVIKIMHNFNHLVPLISHLKSKQWCCAGLRAESVHEIYNLTRYNKYILHGISKVHTVYTIAENQTRPFSMGVKSVILTYL